MKRTAIYMRVSTAIQAQEGDSIPAQRDALLRYIAAHDDMILAGEYLDDGISGTRADRDELNRMLDDVRDGKIDVILVTKLDRLYRSIRHYLNMMDVLDKAGVGWLAIWEPMYDTTTPQGRLIVSQMMSIAQFEAEQTGQRIRQVFAYKAAQGEVISGTTTPGYTIKDKHLVPDSLAPAVKETFEFYARSGCLADTVRFASAYKGLPITAFGIKSMLKRKVYTGEAYGNPDFCEPIVSKELFDKVQLQLSRNIKSSQKRTYLFSGLLKCAECGRSMAACQRTKRGVLVRQYRCAGHYQRAVKSCDNPKVVLETTLEKYLVNNLAQLVDDFRIRAEIEQAPARDAAKQRDTLTHKLARLKDLYLNDLIELDEYRTDKERLQREIDALSTPVKVDFSPIQAFDAEEGINLYQGLEEPEKRLFWRLIIKEIRFDRNRNTEVIFL